MRTLVDIPEDQIQDLASLCEEGNLSRAEVIRRAIAAYIAENRRPAELQGFGLWKNRDLDGLEYQDRMRAEWDR